MDTMRPYVVLVGGEFHGLGYNQPGPPEANSSRTFLWRPIISSLLLAWKQWYALKKQESYSLGLIMIQSVDRLTRWLSKVGSMCQSWVTYVTRLVLQYYFTLSHHTSWNTCAMSSEIPTTTSTYCGSYSHISNIRHSPYLFCFGLVCLLCIEFLRIHGNVSSNEGIFKRWWMRDTKWCK